jgi:hypothetical protein
MKCTIHTEFFEDSCSACKQEYMELKCIDEVGVTSNKKYKEFTEERAKKLYEELLLQYLRSGASEVEADQKAKAIIKKQCNLRKMPFWSWL